jgi:hypothetical protein
MATYTRYLATTATAPNEFTVQISSSVPVAISKANHWTGELRYSPIMPAFLTPKKGPPPVPRKLTSVAFFFANSPYQTLGTIRGHLSNDERMFVYFTEGLASIVLLNFKLERVKKLRKAAGNCPLEYWPLQFGKLDVCRSFIEIPRNTERHSPLNLVLPSSNNVELSVYVEQISASLMSLWISYGISFPTERKTLRQVATLANNLIKQHSRIDECRVRGGDNLAKQKMKNALISALVEVSASLSYAVTQGTSGAIPVLSNRSPFPHHSLLGVGGAVRALTKYTRYIESAFVSRDASNVIVSCYARVKHIIPARIPEYKSGPEYKFVSLNEEKEEYFDVGGKHHTEDYIPLIAHFSLRHGFMENKFFVTAASESLTAETLPHWTLMTLSHEIMHSRVRAIFQALFGKVWGGNEDNVISENQFKEFCVWISAMKHPKKMNVATGLRNAILNFCYVFDVSQHPVPENSIRSNNGPTIDKIREVYSRHKHLAIELFVHFHDYYFVYACQPKLYIRGPLRNVTLTV